MGVLAVEPLIITENVPSRLLTVHVVFELLKFSHSTIPASDRIGSWQVGRHPTGRSYNEDSQNHVFPVVFDPWNLRFRSRSSIH